MRREMKNSYNMICIAMILLISSCLPPTGGEKTELEFKERPQSRKPSAVPGVTRASSIAAFQSTVYPLLRTKTCAACHGESRVVPPYFLVDNVTESWENLVNVGKKVNLSSPASSRIYLRLKNDSHNCFDGDCDTSAALLLAEINEWVRLAGSAKNASGITTGPLTFSAQQTVPAQMEFGTLMLEAEQSKFPQANLGRFETDLDGKASNSTYALTPTVPPNPTTNAVRTASINRSNNCEVISSARLNESTNGPFRITEQDTHINTEKRTTDTNIIIKNGHRPFSISIRGLLIRPDKRMEYAKRLTGWSAGSASGNSDFLDLRDLALTNGNFNTEGIELRSDRRDPGQIDISNRQLEGDNEDYLGFKALPYFTKRDQVFRPSPNTSYISYTDNQNAVIQNLSGSNIPLHLLFALPRSQFTTKQILKSMEEGNLSTASYNYRQHITYKMIKERLDAFSTSSLSYNRIEGMNSNRIFSLYGNLKLSVMACPGNVCSPLTQAIEITAGTDSGGVALTYANSLNILKVNNGGTGFVSGSIPELISGVAFRRIDLYAHIYEPGDSQIEGDAFDNIFYSFNGSTFNEFNRISFPIRDNDSALNLKALYTAGANSLSDDDKLVNFQNTLFPVLRASSCIGCHSNNPNRPQFTNSNSIAAFNDLESNSSIDFSNPSGSFRKTTRFNSAYMVHNCNGANNNDNDTLCANIETTFVNAINSWKSANDLSRVSNNSKQYKELSEKQRTPGQLSYDFIAKETGYYNVWTKIKSGNGTSENISLRIMEGSTPLTTYTGIKSPSSSNTSCVDYTLGDNDNWTWHTPGRSDELRNLNALGEKKLDNEGDPRSISDSRLYWRLEAGKSYTLQIFERAVNTKIDLIAIDKVNNHEDALDFQPDLRARDENNISEYQRRTLSYDISRKVGLPAGSAFFKVEVKEALEGQNYIFRNPRIDSPTTNIRVSDIKVFINGSNVFSDSSWTKINVSTGDDKVLTYAPLVTLVKGGQSSDQFHFSFGVLEKTNNFLTEVDPRGAAPIIIDGRRCKEIDLFMATVKPIFRNARLIRKGEDGLQEYLDDFPGRRRGNLNNPPLYQCMTCHNDTHPYFKMTTFDYPEILCAQALSRVDFDNYRDSLLVRGIDGSGVHPKLYFIEELQYANDFKSIVQYDSNNSSRILDGQIRSQVDGDDGDYFSRWFPGGYFSTYSRSDLGISSSWNSNNSEKKNIAREFLGQIRRIQFDIIPDLTSRNYYEPFIHDELIGETLSETDNLSTGVFNRNGRNRYRTFIPPNANSSLRGPYDIRVQKSGSSIRVDGNDQKIFDVPYNSSEMVEQFESIKSTYRQVILNWIEAEDAARKK